MRIVYLNATGTLGGAELCLLDLLATLRPARPDWDLRVLLCDDGPLRPALEALGIDCDVLPMPARVSRLGDANLGDRGLAGWLGLAGRVPAAAAAASGYLRRLRARLRAERPDRLQTGSMKAHVLGTWAAPRGVPVVWMLQDYIGPRAVMAPLLRRASRRPGVSAVAASRSVADDASRALGPGVPVRLIYNAVDLGRFAPGPGDGAALDASAGLPASPAGTVRVGLVATFARWKGQEVFLEAAARVDPAAPCRFYVVGGPIYRSAGSQYGLEELRARAEALGLGDRVGFTGHQADPATALRSLDVVVHASTRPEPFGRVIVEAMACGRAAVAAGLGGAAELIEDGVTALACPPGDPAALASAIARLVGDEALRRRLGEAGRSAAARFDRDRLPGPWAEAYERA